MNVPLTHTWKSRKVICGGEDVDSVSADKVQDLIVVVKREVCPSYLLPLIVFLLQLEDVFHKELLQLLVSVVYAELFEAATFKTNTVLNMKSLANLSIFKVDLCSLHMSWRSQRHIVYKGIRHFLSYL